MKKSVKDRLEAILVELESLQNSRDPEDAHGKADDLICEALELLGENRIVAAYHEVPKYYA